MKTNKPIHQDDLEKELSQFRYFSDEKCLLVDIKLFVSLFIYKYGGLLSDWNVYFETKTDCFGKPKKDQEFKSKYVLVCERFGFKYCFPLFYS
jgi:hypothetical protein